MTWEPRPIEKAPVERLTGVGYMGSFGRPEPEPIKVPSTWTVLAAEIRRLNALLDLCKRRGTREPWPSNFRTARDEAAATLADLILEGRVR